MAYAAVVSLKQTIESFLLDDSQSRTLPSTSEMEAIYKDVCNWQSFLKTINSLLSSKRVDALETQIKELAHKFEDLIESHVSDLESGNQSLTLVFSPELLKAKQEVTSFVKTLNIKEEYYEEDHQQMNSVSSRNEPGGKNKMVGFVNEQLQLLGWLVLDSSKLDIVTMLGMAGIGKTTLAKEVYYDSFVSQYFQVRSFVSVGPKYKLKQVLLLALQQLGFNLDEMNLKEEKTLGNLLYRFLQRKRYLIVLDDIWNVQVWYELRQFFPDNLKGSRIILITRLADVAPSMQNRRNFLQMPFLNDDESWKLLREIVFTDEEPCDPRLEKAGKKIAKNCEGLPLALVAVGNLLLKREKTVEFWERAAEDDNLLIIRTDDDSPISKSLTLSYKELPHHLKPCFLYMGVFPKDYKISTSKLIKLWVIEGFVEPQKKQSLEKIAEDYLDELVSRNLVLVRAHSSSSGGIKNCKLHFVFRNLCVSEAQNEKFFYVMKRAYSFPEGTCFQRRLCVHNNVVLSNKQVNMCMESVSAARSLLCFGPLSQYPLPAYLRFRLLRVLDAFAIRFYDFPDEVLELVQLKYLAITYDGEHPKSISRLWKLEVLIVRRYHNIKHSNTPVYLPVQIWHLHRLKHLECMGFDLPDPPENGDSFVLEKLLTLSGVTFRSCKPGALARMPSLMKLGVCIEATVITVTPFGDLTNLRRLESFKCLVMNPAVGSHDVSSVPIFPDNLRKILLGGCGFSWEHMACIGRLPNLEVLKLRCSAFHGPVWKTGANEFTRLKLLLLEDLDMEVWITPHRCFQSLTCLIIRDCYKLKELPVQVCKKLKIIEVDDCSPILEDSARQLYAKRHDWVNDYVQLWIRTSRYD